MALKKLVEVLEAEVRNNQTVVDEFKKLLGDQPYRAFQDSRNAMASVAMIQAAQESLHGIEHMRSKGQWSELQIYDECIRYARKNALRMAANRSHSSSMTHNLMDEYTGRAWAKIADFNGIWL